MCQNLFGAKCANLNWGEMCLWRNVPNNQFGAKCVWGETWDNPFPGPRRRRAVIGNGNGRSQWTDSWVKKCGECQLGGRSRSIRTLYTFWISKESALPSKQQFESHSVADGVCSGSRTIAPRIIAPGQLQSIEMYWEVWVYHGLTVLTP